MIVLGDADLDGAADAAVSAGYGSAGELCMAISAIVAVGDIRRSRLSTRTATWIPKAKVGDGFRPGFPRAGPLVTSDHRDRVASGVEGTRPARARLSWSTAGRACPRRASSSIPSLLDDVTPQMKAYVDEIFGPALGGRVGTYEEAVRLVNENLRGQRRRDLHARHGRGNAVSSSTCGQWMVGINVPGFRRWLRTTPSAGWKASLFGDRRVYKPEAIDFYTRGKVVTQRWPDPATSTIDLGFPQTR